MRACMAAVTVSGGWRRALAPLGDNSECEIPWSWHWKAAGHVCIGGKCVEVCVCGRVCARGWMVVSVVMVVCVEVIYIYIQRKELMMLGGGGSRGVRSQ